MYRKMRLVIISIFFWGGMIGSQIYSVNAKDYLEQDIIESQEETGLSDQELYQDIEKETNQIEQKKNVLLPKQNITNEKVKAITKQKIKSSVNLKVLGIKNEEIKKQPFSFQVYVKQPENNRCKVDINIKWKDICGNKKQKEDSYVCKKVEKLKTYNIKEEGFYDCRVLVKQKKNVVKKLNTSFTLDCTPPVIPVDMISKEYQKGERLPYKDWILESGTVTLDGKEYLGDSLEVGEHIVKIDACDQAGNHSDYETKIQVNQKSETNNLEKEKEEQSKVNEVKQNWPISMGSTVFVVVFVIVKNVMKTRR